MTAVQPGAGGPFLLLDFLIGDDLPVAAVADMGSHFVKLRLTYYDEPKKRVSMSDAALELCRLVLAQMGHFASSAPEEDR